MCERSFSWLHSFTPGTGTCSPAYGTLVSMKLVPLLVGRPPGQRGVGVGVGLYAGSNMLSGLFFFISLKGLRLAAHE